jgi:type I restriction enzyme S subunit
MLDEAAERVHLELARGANLLDRLDQAILAKAFRGELVPQDPNDEPASVLLQRIRASRAAEGEPPIRRRRLPRGVGRDRSRAPL